jgi:hypothetical protein
MPGGVGVASAVRVSPDTMTWPPCAAVHILAAVCTAIPM